MKSRTTNLSISARTVKSPTGSVPNGMHDAIKNLAEEYDVLRSVHPDPAAFDEEFQREVKSCHDTTDDLANAAIDQLLKDWAGKKSAP